MRPRISLAAPTRALKTYVAARETRAVAVGRGLRHARSRERRAGEQRQRARRARAASPAPRAARRRRPRSGRTGSQRRAPASLASERRTARSAGRISVGRSDRPRRRDDRHDASGVVRRLRVVGPSRRNAVMVSVPASRTTALIRTVATRSPERKSRSHASVAAPAQPGPRSVALPAYATCDGSWTASERPRRRAAEVPDVEYVRDRVADGRCGGRRSRLHGEIGSRSGATRRRRRSLGRRRHRRADRDGLSGGGLARRGCRDRGGAGRRRRGSRSSRCSRPRRSAWRASLTTGHSGSSRAQPVAEDDESATVTGRPGRVRRAGTRLELDRQRRRRALPAPPSARET